MQVSHDIQTLLQAKNNTFQFYQNKKYTKKFVRQIFILMRTKNIFLFYLIQLLEEE